MDWDVGKAEIKPFLPKKLWPWCYITAIETLRHSTLDAFCSKPLPSLLCAGGSSPAFEIRLKCPPLLSPRPSLAPHPSAPSQSLTSHSEGSRLIMILYQLSTHTQRSQSRQEGGSQESSENTIGQGEGQVAFTHSQPTTAQLFCNKLQTLGQKSSSEDSQLCKRQPMASWTPGFHSRKAAGFLHPDLPPCQDPWSTVLGGMTRGLELRSCLSCSGLSFLKVHPCSDLMGPAREPGDIPRNHQQRQSWFILTSPSDLVPDHPNRFLLQFRSH